MFKKILSTLLISLTLGLALTPAIAMAQDNPEEDGFFEDTTIEVLKSFQRESGFSTLTGDTSPVAGEGDRGIDNITGVLNTIIRLLQFVAGVVAVGFLVATIVQMIASPPEQSEENYTNLKKHLLYIVIAVVIILSAEFVFTEVFNLRDGGFLASEEAAREAGRQGSQLVRGLYNFIQAIVGVLAVAALVIAGFRMVSNAGNEETQSEAKRQITYAVLGLILIGISEVVVKDILFRNEGTSIGVDRAKELIVQLTNFASGFIATFAVVSLFYAGYLYIFSGVGQDNTEKVKKVVIGAVIGILVAAGAFAIVNTVVKLDSSDVGETLTEDLEAI